MGGSKFEYNLRPASATNDKQKQAALSDQVGSREGLNNFFKKGLWRGDHTEYSYVLLNPQAAREGGN